MAAGLRPQLLCRLRLEDYLKSRVKMSGNIMRLHLEGGKNMTERTVLPNRGVKSLNIQV